MNMDGTAKIYTCAVCGLNPGEVYASSLGPTSYARCATCLDQNAESIGVICLTLFLEGGPESAAERSPDDWWLHHFKTYSEGRYIGWQEILALYPEWKAQFKKD